jgi:hypothetical protein
MKGFLNSFMSEHRNLDGDFGRDAEGMFKYTINFVYETIGKRAFKLSRVLNAALFDSIMVGLARRLRNGEIKNRSAFISTYDELLRYADFREMAERATANEENVYKRIMIATHAFADLT